MKKYLSLILLLSFTGSVNLFSEEEMLPMDADNSIEQVVEHSLVEFNPNDDVKSKNRKEIRVELKIDTDDEESKNVGKAIFNLISKHGLNINLWNSDSEFLDIKPILKRIIESANINKLFAAMQEQLTQFFEFANALNQELVSKSPDFKDELVAIEKSVNDINKPINAILVSIKSILNSDKFKSILN